MSSGTQCTSGSQLNPQCPKSLIWLLHGRQRKGFVGESFLGFGGSTVVKNLPVTPETQVRLLGREDPLEEEIATHSNSLAWEIP